MEQSLFLVWTCLLEAGLALVQPPAFPATTFTGQPRPPRLIGCVFIIRSNVTCHWEPGDIPAILYTLQVQRMPFLLLRRSEKDSTAANGFVETFTCITTGTRCTLRIPNLKVRIYFCISIMAHSERFNISSEPRCQTGRKEAVLPPVILDNIKQVLGSPECLNISWHRILSVFPVSDSEIENGDLNSQIEFQSQTLVSRSLLQPDVHIHNVTLTALSVLVCLFKPDTSYIIRLRNRYQSPASPWSPWSNSLQGRTSEDAPSAAPVFWRQVKHTDVNQQMVVSLLWKPLPSCLANGRVLFYNVTCLTENAQPLSDYGSCRDLHYPSTSCIFPLPASHFSCTLTASTSAGKSPEARIWFLGTTESELPPPSQVTARPLDDSSLEVHWTSPRNRSVSGFVVEWFAVREKSSSILHWEKLNSSYTKLVMTEGVNPMECYAVSVKTLYSEQGPGKNRTVHIYTRQGTPSAGPNVTVQHIFGSKVELSWSPVPVEWLQGFLSSYTLFYATKNQKAKSVSVPGHVHRYTLENLSHGNYDIFMQANTVAGTGPPGTLANVHIGSEDISIVMSVFVPLMTSILVLVACVVQMKMIKQRLCREVPDPSNSSLANWTPETILKSKMPIMIQEKPDIKYSEVILLDKLQDLEEDEGYWWLPGLQTYSIHQFSSLPGGTSRTALTTSVTKAKETSVTNLFTSPCIYSDIPLSETLKNLPSPLPSSSSDCEPSAIGLNVIMLQHNRVSESSDLHPSGGEKSGLRLDHLQSLMSFSDSENSRASALFSHQNEFSRLNSVLPPQPNICQSQAQFDSFINSFSLFPQSGFVDYTYCSVQCESSVPTL